MNCTLVTFDAFKCLLLFKQKLKPRSEFSGGFLNKKIVWIWCAQAFIMKPQNKIQNDWKVPQLLKHTTQLMCKDANIVLCGRWAYFQI